VEVSYIKALWGMPGPLADSIRQIAEAGYTGVEAPLPAPEQEQQFRELLERYRLDYIAMVFSGGKDASEHIHSIEQQVERARGFSPLLINSHSARDVMSFEEQLRFFARALELEQQLGIAIGHETHRGRAMFTPWATSRLLQELPELKLVADFSHWVCVCESLLPDMEGYLEQAISRTIHIHGRVGYAQGPQVPDPSAPEYAAELAAHMGWWERIVTAREKQGAKRITFTPEFGPPGYMHTLPHTNVPVADLWKVCLWMRDYAEEKLRR
jgi:hypothetical protein